jgi:hypothetical protein
MICRRVIVDGVLIGMIFLPFAQAAVVTFTDRQCGIDCEPHRCVQEHYNGVREVKRRFVVYR